MTLLHAGGTHLLKELILQNFWRAGEQPVRREYLSSRRRDGGTGAIPPYTSPNISRFRRTYGLLTSTNKVVSASVAPRIEHRRFAVGITDIRGVGVEGAIVAGSGTEPKVYRR